MQGLSPSKNTEGYFVLQVGSTLSKDAIIHYFARGHFRILCTGGISPISTKASSHWITQVPFISCWWVFLQLWHICGICSEDSRSKNEATLGDPKYSKILFSQAQLVQAWTPKRHRVPAGGAHRQDPHDIDDPHYPAWISGKQAFTLNKEDESFQQWEVQSSQLRKSLLRCAKGEPSRSRRSCWWRRGGLAGPAPRGTRLSLVQV